MSSATSTFYTPEVGAVCGKAARTDLCGGREVTRVPTATLFMSVYGTDFQLLHCKKSRRDPGTADMTDGLSGLNSEAHDPSLAINPAAEGAESPQRSIRGKLRLSRGHRGWAVRSRPAPSSALRWRGGGALARLCWTWARRSGSRRAAPHGAARAGRSHHVPAPARAGEAGPSLPAPVLCSRGSLARSLAYTVFARPAHPLPLPNDLVTFCVTCCQSLNRC